MLKEEAEHILTTDYIDIDTIDRKEQLKEIESEILQPLFEKQTLPKSIYIYGGSGSGKTFIVKKMETEMLKAKNIFTKFKYIYYNVSEQSGSFYTLLLDIASVLAEFFPFMSRDENGNETMVELPMRGKTIEECINVINLTIDKFKPTILVVIDEIEKMKEYDKCIKWFMDERKNYNDFWGISCIAISNDPYLTEKLRLEVRSRIQYTIHFTSYTMQDFFEIIRVFSQKCFDNTLGDDVMIRIAEGVSQVSSSVRDLKFTLYHLSKSGDFSLEAIKKAVDKSQLEIFKREVLSKPLQQKLVLLSIASYHKRLVSYEEKRMKGLTKYALLPTIKNIFFEYKKIASQLARENPWCEPREYTTFVGLLTYLKNSQLVTVDVKGLGRGQGKVGYVYPKNVSWEYYYDLFSKEFGITP